MIILGPDTKNFRIVTMFSIFADIRVGRKDFSISPEDDVAIFHDLKMTNARIKTTKRKPCRLASERYSITCVDNNNNSEWLQMLNGSDARIGKWYVVNDCVFKAGLLSLQRVELQI